MLYQAAIFFFLTVTCTGFTSAQTPVHITVYYESLCPDSVKFITKQLYPTWTKMMKYMNVEFIPYGNSNTTKAEDGHYEFVCQHGPAECYGNKVQACGLSYINQDDKQMKFINCIMSAKNASAAGLECATDINVNYSMIQKCEDSREGDDVLNRMGERTKSLTPPLSGVPTVVFNNNYEKSEQAMATSNFMAALCHHITGTKPSECSGKSGSPSVAPLIPWMVATAFAAILVY